MKLLCSPTGARINRKGGHRFGYISQNEGVNKAMGLDTSHEAWHGAYSAFMRWRQEISRAAGLPPLDLMEAFYDPPPFWMKDVPDHVKDSLPIRWEALRPDPLYILLHHSDCSGEIEWTHLKLIADRLKELLPLMKRESVGGHIGDYRDKTQTFIDGCLRAYEAQEDLEFH